MATNKRRMRDFQRCLRTIQSFSDNQAHISSWDEEALEWIQVLVKPKDGYYATGQFEFKIFFERDYPKCPPRVDCITPIYHPNIDSTCEDYNVCLNLFDCWEEKFGLEDIIQGLLFLMYNPNIEDPLSPYFDPSMEEEDFKASVEKSLLGEEVENTEEYPRNLSVEPFDEDALAKSIDVILEKASQMLLNEEEENDHMDSDSGSVVDVSTASEDQNIKEEAVSLESSDLGQAAAIARLDSKVDKLDITCSAGDVTETGAAAASHSDTNQTLARNIARYIPRTFITPQPDFLVNAFMACVDMATR